VEFRILGPLEVLVGGNPVRVTAPRQRAVLAALLLHPDEVVPVRTLVEAVWEDRPPNAPANQLAICVSALRRLLRHGLDGDEIIVTQPPGYRLSVRGVSLDTLLAERDHRRALELIAAGSRSEAVTLLDSALARWRGSVLAGLERQVLQPAVRHWEEKRLALWDLWAQTKLDLGRHKEILAPLSALTEQHPLLERPRAQLMTALYRAGRQADALKLYRDTRDQLRDELGLEPGAQLQRLHEKVLRGELPPPAPPAPPVAPTAPRASESGRTNAGAPHTGQDTPGPVPQRAQAVCMLPNDTADFSGREHEIAEITRLLDTDSGVVPVVGLCGWGGVGKTALALHTAHLLRDAFEDAQLYVNLWGMGAHPLEPAQILGMFLRELGVHGSLIPEGLEERASMYRGLLADRKALIVLDNAADAAQVLPLIPGTGGCAVIVTSRVRLTAVPGLRLVELDLLDQKHALDMLGRIIGADRLAAEPAAGVDLVEYCGRLPLALRVAGAKLAAKKHWRLGQYAARLADEKRRLDELSYSNLEVRANIALSYEGLSRDARRLFRLLGLLEAADFPAWVGQALVAAPGDEVEQLLEELIDAQLVSVLGSGVSGQARYRLHDLVRLFARKLAQESEPVTAQRASIARVGRAWLGLLTDAHQHIIGGDYAVAHSASVRWDPDPTALPWAGDPPRWYEAERHNLPLLCAQIAEYRFDELCWDLAATGVSLFGTRSHYDEWERTHESALTITREKGNRLGEATSLLGLGDLYLTRRQYERAAELLAQACELFRKIDARHGYALALRKVACVDRDHGRFEDALRRWREALTLLTEFGDLGAQSHVLRWIGQTLLDFGDHAAAEPYLRRAIEVTRSLGGRGAAQALFNLGELHLAQQRLTQAEQEFTEVLAMTRTLGDLRGQAHARLGLGQLCLAAHRVGPAAEWLRDALALARSTLDGLLEIRVLAAMIELREHEDEPSLALAHSEEMLRISTRLGLPIWSARCLATRARLLAGVDPRAAELARAAAARAAASTGSALSRRLVTDVAVEHRHAV
jgi:DNA-binding SARP family transcriptional activator